VTRTLLLIVLFLLSGVATVRAQKPAPEPAAPAATPAPVPNPALPTPPANFQYNPEGRRDPFVSLVNRGSDARGQAAIVKRPEGVAGLDTASLVVKGIMQSRGAWLAMVAGLDGKVYTVRAGDRLFDGVIRTITAQAVVILQEVNDPLSLEKQREVRKFLRGGDEVK
jgi:Tfp pilus assembly protein PilP